MGRIKKITTKMSNYVFGEKDIHILAIGPSGVGKSTFGNALLGIEEDEDDVYFRTSGLPESCTQTPSSIEGPILDKDGNKIANLIYTDLPGIPDTNPAKTKEFYNMIIEQAKNKCTAILFVFAVEGRLDEATKERFKTCALLFRELKDNCSASKFLVLNDKQSFVWSKPKASGEAFDKKKNEANKERRVAQEAYEYEIKKVMENLDFQDKAIILNGQMHYNPNNMEDAAAAFKYGVLKFGTHASPELRDFTQLEAYVEGLKRKKNYEQTLVANKRRAIERLQEQLTALEITLGAATVTAAACTAGAFFTFGVTAAAAAVAAGTITTTTVAIEMKKAELERAKQSISEANMKAAVKLFEEECLKFEELADKLK